MSIVKKSCPRVLGLIAVYLVFPVTCWTSSYTFQCTHNVVKRDYAGAFSKVRMADTAKPSSSIAEPKLFGSRRLYRWMHKTQKIDARINEDETRGLDLIKLITIAKLHSDAAGESTRAVSHVAGPKFPRCDEQNSSSYPCFFKFLSSSVTYFFRCRSSSLNTNSAVNHEQRTVCTRVLRAHVSIHSPNF
jgi:hypothetical protein